MYGCDHIPGNRIGFAPNQNVDNMVTTGEGTWKNKVIHFVPDGKPGFEGNETGVEYIIKYEDFQKAVWDIWAVRDKFAHLIANGEYRMIEPDDIPMSCYKTRKSVSMHFHWVPKDPEVRAAIRLLESILCDKYGAKPHHAKYFQASGDYYEKCYGTDLFILRDLMKKYDPEGKFRNNHLDKYIFNEPDGPKKTMAKL